MKYLFTIIGHVLGDFIFQSSQMAVGKRSSWRTFAWHWLIYASCIALSLIWFAPLTNVVTAILIIILSHGLIDYGIGVWLCRIRSGEGEAKTFDFSLFILDQILHLLIIAVAVANSSQWLGRGSLRLLPATFLF